MPYNMAAVTQRPLDLNLGPLTPKSGMLPLDHCDTAIACDKMPRKCHDGPMMFCNASLSVVYSQCYVIILGRHEGRRERKRSRSRSRDHRSRDRDRDRRRRSRSRSRDKKRLLLLVTG